MAMTKQELAETIRVGWVGQLATCEYKGKRRDGEIAGVKQGPVEWGWNEIGQEVCQFLNEPTGDVYVDWRELQATSTKTFNWALITDLRLASEPQPSLEMQLALAVTLSVRRPRITGD